MPNVPSVRRTPVPGSSGANKSYVHFSDKLTGTLQEVSKAIDENKEIIDTVQELGIELSHTIGSIAVTAVKYAKVVDSLLDVVVPIITSIPLTPKKTVEFLNDVRSMADKIIASCESSQKIADDVEKGLVSGDVGRLKTHSAELKKVTASVRDALPDR